MLWTLFGYDTLVILRIIIFFLEDDYLNFHYNFEQNKRQLQLKMCILIICMCVRTCMSAIATHDPTQNKPEFYMGFISNIKTEWVLMGFVIHYTKVKWINFQFSNPK